MADELLYLSSVVGPSDAGRTVRTRIEKRPKVRDIPRYVITLEFYAGVSSKWKTSTHMIKQPQVHRWTRRGAQDASRRMLGEVVQRWSL